MKRNLLFLIIATLFAQFSVAKKSVPMNVMSYNIRCVATSDGDNQWMYRKDFAADLIKFHDVDIFGAQEVTHEQLMDMLGRLPEYAYIGVGRTDGKMKGEYTPIFYKKERFKLLKSGHFWLAEDKDAVGKKGWDSACERVASWGIFKDNESGKKFFFLNTHLDHMGKRARHEGALLVLQEVEALSEGLPVFVTGDFNAVPSDDPIQVLTNESDERHLTHARNMAEFVYGPEWTFHGFGRVPLKKRGWIDYIFVKGEFRVLKYAVLTETLNHLYPSDHCPLLSTMIIE